MIVIKISKILEDHLILLGIFLGILFWVIDILLDVFYFRERTVIQQLYFPTPMEIYSRLITMGLFIFSGAVGQKFITEKKRAIDAIKSSEEHFRSLIENSFDITTVLNSEGHVLYNSPSIRQMLGYEPDEFLGRRIFDKIHPEDRQHIIDVFNQAIKTTDFRGCITYRFACKDGSWRNLESVGKKTFSEREGAILVLNTHDISESKRVEVEL